MQDRPWDALDELLPRAVREALEARLWRPIEAEATLEALVRDPAFLADPGSHPAMFADHGVTHARDVAIGVVRLVELADGVVLPSRPPERRRFVAAVGVATAYLHDIGMVDMTPVGRRTHPLYAAHAAYWPDVDDLVAHLLADETVGGRLAGISAEQPFAASTELVVREILGLSAAHSKSTVPAAVLDDRSDLRRLMQRIVFTPLDVLRAAGRTPRADDAAPAPQAAHAGRYEDPSVAYAWLDAPDGLHAELADDVVDAIRVMRAADVLRQRGTTLRTSGGFELCFDARTARAVCTLRPAGGEAAYVVSYDDDRCAGEANVRVAMLTPAGDLRIAFHRGVFGDGHAAARAADSVAEVIVDIQADVLPSLAGRPLGGGLGPARREIGSMRLLLERPADRPEFADEVAARVLAREPSLRDRLAVVAGVESASAIERARFHAGCPVEADDPAIPPLLEAMEARGADVAGMDVGVAFAEVVRTRLAPGELLVEHGSSPVFVYVPLGPGLVVRPGGGYAAARLHPWVAVGTTGVIRRSERNSDIVAEDAVDVLMIPGELYARAWLRPLRPDSLAARLGTIVPAR